MPGTSLYNNEERCVIYGMSLMCLSALKDDGIISWKEFETIRQRMQDKYPERKEEVHTQTDRQPIILSDGECPVWAKHLLTIQEANEYFGIGTNKLREMTAGEDRDFVIWNGSRRMIKRELFEEYLNSQFSI